MVFWAAVVLAITAMLGVLLVAPTQMGSLAFGTDIISFALLGGVAVSWLLLAYLPHTSLPRVLKMTATALLLLLFVLLCGARAYNAHQQYLQNTIAQPIQVVANVHISELSDSSYHPAHNRSYRQKAHLSDIAPVDGGEVVGLPSTMTVLLTAYPHKPSARRPDDPLANLADIRVGEMRKMTLKLSPIVPVQDTGFDSYRWLVGRHIHANAQIVRVGEPLAFADGFLLRIERQRERFRGIFEARWTDDSQGAAVALSLLTGDRSLIDKSTKTLYQYAGISHLLAISGTHVLFLAILMANLISALVNRGYPALYYRVPRWQMRWAVMASVGLLYALFTGFDVPAIRTVLMLLMLGAARYLLLGWSPFKVLSLTALLMALADPYVLWQAGFWLSFVAVGLLLVYEEKQATLHAWAHLWYLVKLQTYLFVAMLPLTLLLFGKVSLWGLVVNLFAVPLFGWLIVPINLLAGVLHGFVPSVAVVLWQLVISILGGLHAVLASVFLLFGQDWLGLPISPALVVLVALAFWLWYAAFIPRRLVLLPLFVLACALFGSRQSSESGVVVTILPSAYPSLHATLIQVGEDNYLILSFQESRRVPEMMAVSEALALQLQKARVTQLTAIVVQNDHSLPLQVAGQLSLSLPTHQLYAPSSVKVGKLQARPCGARQALPLTDKALNAQFVTGWQVGEETMRACSLMLAGAKPLTVQTNDKQTYDYPNTALIIDGASDERLWQLYRLLCQDKFNADIIITAGAMDDDLASLFGKPALLPVNGAK